MFQKVTVAQNILAMRNNDTQHIVRLSRALPERTVLSSAHMQHHGDTHETVEQFSSFAVSRGKFGKFVTLLLLPMIFVYPLAPAYAADEAATSTATTEVPADTSSTPDAPATPADTNSLAADLSSAVAGAADLVSGLFSSGDSSTTDTTAPDDAQTEASTTPAEDDTGTPTDTATTTTEGDTASSTDITDTASSTESTDTASSTESSDASTTPVFGGVETGASSTEATTTEATTEASSTDAQVAPEQSAQEIAREMLREKEDSLRASIRKEVEDEFTKGCVSLDTTGYYCLKDRPNSEGSLTPSTVITSVSSLPDATGQWKQVFITRGGTDEQLTHYAWDNSFPATDISGKSVVWQGNVNGRWQIFFAGEGASTSLDLFQVTHSNESNFNPKVDGNDVVWQGWVDGNWEIFLAEHLTADNYLSSTSLPVNNKLLSIDNTWKVTRITNNPGHDMFPSVAGGLVTWQSFQDNSWNVYVYSVKTGSTQKISKSGEKSEQPRFAITWDERTTEGNARMIGYDIASGKTIDLTNEARQVNDAKPFTPTPTPVSQPDQAALPITGAGTSTTAKSEGDSTGSSTPNGLDI